MRLDLALLTAAAAMARGNPEGLPLTPPAWASAAMLLAVAVLALVLRLTRRRPAPMRSGEAARRRLGLASELAPPIA